MTEVAATLRIVDDEPVNREALANLLAPRGPRPPRSRGWPGGGKAGHAAGKRPGMRMRP
jgi:hypothetical protein